MHWAAWDSERLFQEGQVWTKVRGGCEDCKPVYLKRRGMCGESGVGRRGQQIWAGFVPGLSSELEFRGVLYLYSGEAEACTPAF